MRTDLYLFTAVHARGDMVITRRIKGSKSPLYNHRSETESET